MSDRRLNRTLTDLSVLACIFAISLFLSVLFANENGALSAPGGTWPSTDFTTSKVPLHEFQSGGPPKDGIPSIDAPKFSSVSEADKWLSGDDPVILVTAGKTVKAYPLSIMLWHEIINDSLNNTPIAVTYCPLCSAAICFDRRAAGRTLTFGTTGSLRKSDMIMYDRQTESWWQQYTGEALAGKLVGKKLKLISSSIIPYKTLKNQFPEAKILSITTGFPRKYGTTPYPGYDDPNGEPFLYKTKIKTKLPKMARVLGVFQGRKSKAYPLSLFENRILLNDNIGEIPLLLLGQGTTRSDLDKNSIKESKLAPTASVFKRKIGNLILDFEQRKTKSILDKQTHSNWNSAGICISGKLRGKRLEMIPTQRTFAFAWFEFYPSSELFDQP